MVGDVLASLPDLAAEVLHLLERLARLPCEQITARADLPVEGSDLLPGQPDQRVSRPESVVYEGQRVVLRERHEPQRQLGEVHRERVPVHTVEALLGDEAAGEDRLVLVDAESLGVRRGPSTPR